MSFSVLPETQVVFFFFFLVAGQTGNEEFWACLSELILQRTGGQQGLLPELSELRGHGFTTQVLCLAAGHFQSKQCQWFQRMPRLNWDQRRPQRLVQYLSSVKQTNSGLLWGLWLRCKNWMNCLCHRYRNTFEYQQFQFCSICLHPFNKEYHVACLQMYYWTWSSFTMPIQVIVCWCYVSLKTVHL